MIAAVAAPFAILLNRRSKRRAFDNNRKGRCGVCGVVFTNDGTPLYVVESRFICESCANRERRRLSVALPAAVLIGGITAVSTVAGVVFGGVSDITWWIGPKLIYVLLPAALLGAGSLTVLRRLQRQSKLLNSPVSPTELSALPND